MIKKQNTKQIRTKNPSHLRSSGYNYDDLEGEREKKERLTERKIGFK